MNQSDQFDSLIRRSYADLPAPPQSRQRVMRRLGGGWRHAEWVLAGLVAVVASLLTATLAASSIDVLLRLAVRHWDTGSALRAFAPLFQQPLLWASLMSTILIAVMLALVHTCRNRSWSTIKENSMYRLLLNQKPRLALLSAGVVAASLVSTSAYAYYQTSQRPALSRAVLEQRLAAAGTQANEAEIPSDAADITLPDCATSNAAICVYHFGDTNGGDVIVAPAATLTNPARVQALGQQLYQQAAGKLAHHTAVRASIFTSRSEAQTVPVYVQASQDHRPLTQAEAAQIASGARSLGGEWDCSVQGGCTLTYWDAMSADPQHRHKIVLRQPAVATQSALNAAQAAAAAASH